ncbi:MAG: hypothetical protein U1A06_21010 [Hoeflea sp.]|nr:hypothetical protein [Hoeflea sp.]
MSKTRRIKGGYGWLRMLCALSLLLVAFAHRPLAVESAPAISTADLAAYVLPDGTLPDLCLTGGDDGADHSAATHCEACRIVSAVDLPSPFDGFEIARWIAADGLAVPQVARLAYPVLLPGASPRAPPFLTA